jgi:single-stranded-DNA-specific exonuclease
MSILENQQELEGRLESSLILEEALSALGKKWELTQSDERAALQICQTYNLPLVIGQILASRGIDFQDVEVFLDPSLKVQLPNPSTLKDMDKAADRIADAIVNREKIAVFGDYDVDGATSTAVLKRFFQMAGHDIRVYIPDRIDEGYGPNINAFETLKSEGAKVCLTVDCGITAFEPIEAGTDMGMDMIILDHHAAEPRLPKSYACVNANRLDDESGLGHLAAVGIAFLTCVAVNRSLRQKGYYDSGERSEPRLPLLLDLVALGTVCDVVPLTDVNRAFVAQGLRVMAMRQNIGLKTLADVAGVNEMPKAFHAGFMIGPRINAGGRVGEASTGSTLLSTDDPVLASELANKLNHYNAERRDIEAAVLEQAIDQIEQRDISNDYIVMAAGEGWHPGVVGIVASRLKEKYNRPAAVIGLDENGVGKASARSVSQVDLGNIIIAARQNEILVAGGGHKMAAGFTVMQDRIDELRQFVNMRIEQTLKGQPLLPVLKADGVLSVSSLTLPFVKQLNKLEPFGANNPEPRFILENVKIARPSVVGEHHIRCYLQDVAGGQSITGISFRAVDTPLEAILLKSKNKTVSLAGYASINVWQGRESVQFQILDAMDV